jgi:hypothetical protein
MALHLLSSYGSDDESDCDDEPTSTSVGRADDPSPAAVASQQRSGLLEADESCSSSSDSETESEAADSPVKQAPPEREEAAPPAAKRRLPSAAEAFSTTMKTTVLVNEYERAAMEHEAMLSRHVPLTDPKKTKPVCKAFRRGMCRRGKNCRYIFSILFSSTIHQSKDHPSVIFDGPRDVEV